VLKKQQEINFYGAKEIEINQYGDTICTGNYTEIIVKII